MSQFCGQEDLARQFWGDIELNVEIAAVFGLDASLKSVKTRSRTPSQIKTHMRGIYNCARRLLQGLDSGTCADLVEPPDGATHTSLTRESRRAKLEQLKGLLLDLANDANPDLAWEVDRSRSFRLDYELLSVVKTTAELSKLRLSVPVLTELVYTVLDIQNADVTDAIRATKPKPK